ncbi:hypothetical protein AcW1_002001 [Taiwanofungus camphoratus]|nr:hypothetical protein AcW1_002001 [Antrodia cinnamomea]
MPQMSISEQPKPFPRSNDVFDIRHLTPKPVKSLSLITVLFDRVLKCRLHTRVASGLRDLFKAGPQPRFDLHLIMASCFEREDPAIPYAGEQDDAVTIVDEGYLAQKAGVDPRTGDPWKPQRVSKIKCTPGATAA